MTKKRLSYPEALALDRDKYLKQRNRLIAALRPILVAHGGKTTDAMPKILKEARRVLEDCGVSLDD